MLWKMRILLNTEKSITIFIVRNAVSTLHHCIGEKETSVREFNSDSPYPSTRTVPLRLNILNPCTIYKTDCKELCFSSRKPELKQPMVSLMPYYGQTVSCI